MSLHNVSFTSASSPFGSIEDTSPESSLVDSVLSASVGKMDGRNMREIRTLPNFDVETSSESYGASSSLVSLSESSGELKTLSASHSESSSLGESSSLVSLSESSGELKTLSASHSESSSLGESSSLVSLSESSGELKSASHSASSSLESLSGSIQEASSNKPRLRDLPSDARELNGLNKTARATQKYEEEVTKLDKSKSDKVSGAKADSIKTLIKNAWKSELVRAIVFGAVAVLSLALIAGSIAAVPFSGGASLPFLLVGVLGFAVAFPLCAQALSKGSGKAPPEEGKPGANTAQQKQPLPGPQNIVNNNNASSSDKDLKSEDPDASSGTESKSRESSDNESSHATSKSSAQSIENKNNAHKSHKEENVHGDSPLGTDSNEAATSSDDNVNTEDKNIAPQQSVSTTKAEDVPVKPLQN